MVPFGFGISDFIAVGTLATQIAKALSDSRGATATYGSLIALLQSIYILVGQIRSYLSSSPLTAQIQLDPAALNALRHHLECCQLLMTQFLVDSKCYTDSILKGKPSGVKAQLRKIQWAAFKEDDARKLEQRLQSHMNAAQLILNLIFNKSQAETSHSGIAIANRIESKIDILAQKFGQMLVCQQTIERSMPHTMGYPWETEIPIFFEDVFGRCHRLPQILCRDVETFCDTLRLLFRSMVDHDGIGRWEDYEIVEDSAILPGLRRHVIDSGSGYDPKLWYETVRPGRKLAMNIVRTQKIAAKRDALIPLVPKNRNCPKCGTICPGTKLSACRCKYTFGISVEECLDFRRDFFTPEANFQAWPDTSLSTRPEARPNGNLPSTAESPMDPLAHRLVRVSFNYSNAVSPKFKREENAFMRVRYVTNYLIPRHSQSRNEVKIFSRNPLSHAVARCDVNWARKILCNTGADPNAWDADDMTPLTRICQDPIGDFESVVKLLVKHGADVNRASFHGERGYLTPLSTSTERGDIALVNLLLGLGADVNDTGPLQRACQGGNVEIVKILLAAGAHFNAETIYHEFGWTANPLQEACRAGHVEIVKILLAEGAHVNFYGRERNAHPQGTGTPLQEACRGGHVETVRTLLAAGANVNLGPYFSVYDRRTRRYEDYHGPLWIACGSGSMDLATMLIEAGAHLNPDSGKIPLQVACANGHLDIIRMLIAGGADVNECDSKNGTPLQAACAMGHLDVVRMLLMAGANVNESPENQGTPLRTDRCLAPLLAACESRDIALVKLLIDAGARVNDPSGARVRTTPLVAAIAGKISGESWDELCEAKDEEKSMALVRCLIGQGADVKAPSFSVTALGAAARTRQIRVLRELLRLGADVNQTCVDGRTALQEAIPHIETMKLLLDQGADVNAIQKPASFPALPFKQQRTIDTRRL